MGSQGLTGAFRRLSGGFQEMGLRDVAGGLQELTGAYRRLVRGRCQRVECCNRFVVVCLRMLVIVFVDACDCVSCFVLFCFLW